MKTRSYDRLDTNIALRLADPNNVHHLIAQAAVAAVSTRGQMFAIFPQIIYEFWVNATRPKTVNGLGMSIANCQLEIAVLRKLATLLPDLPNLFAEWESLVASHQCQGKTAHDARLVAAMRTHRLVDLLTLNLVDFRRYPGLTVIDPVSP